MNPGEVPVLRQDLEPELPGGPDVGLQLACRSGLEVGIARLEEFVDFELVPRGAQHRVPEGVLGLGIDAFALDEAELQAAPEVDQGPCGEGPQDEADQYLQGRPGQRLGRVGLGRLPLLEPDEGRNAEVGREMLVSGEPIGAAEAWRIGLVNAVTPAGELLDFSRAWLGSCSSPCGSNRLGMERWPFSC